MKSCLTLLTFLVHIFYVVGQEKPTPPEGMVYVPAGEFIMGSVYGDPDERPQQIASTKAFFIDKYEVSNTEFAKFDPTFKFPPEKKNNAAIVTWSKADAYAKWAGK
ncbi:MAG: SUMF1/EgtB/PvdO family nonheme iron enzyme, partial [Arenibacter sp.]